MRVKLEELVEEVSERTTINNQHPVLTSSRSGIYLQEDYFKKQVASKDNTGYRVIRKGEFTYRAMSDTGEFYPNKLECTDIGIVSPAYPVFKIKDYRILPDYLKYYFKSRSFQKSITAFVQGSTRASMKFGKMKSISIDLPDEDKQNQILNTIGILENIIDKYELEIDHLNNLIKARFVEMFGVPGANSKGWNEIKLGEVCSLQNGYAFKSSDYINKSGVLNCRMSNIRPDGGFDAEYHPKYLPEEYWDKCSGYRLFDGDVIIAMTDMASDPKILGVPTIVSTNGKKFLLNQRVGKLSFLHDDRMNRVYLMHSLGQKYIRKELAKSAAGSTQINVGKPAILNINIYDPPRSLQDQFATFVAQVDKSKFVLSNELTMCDLYIRLIHDRVMHGRINLRVAQ